METLIHHTKTDPLPPSERTELGIPETLDRLILACLVKNPDERPATADVVAARLAEIETDARWSQERAAEWWELAAP